MLEQKIQELTVAVVALTAAFADSKPTAGEVAAVVSKTFTDAAKQGGLANQPPADKPAKEEKTPKVDKPEKLAKEQVDALKALVQPLVKAGKQEAVVALLKSFNAPSYSAVKPSDYDAVTAKLNELGATPVTETKQEPKELKEPTVTKDDLIKLAKPFLTQADLSASAKEAVQTLVKKYGAAKVSEVAEDKIPAFYAEFKAIVDANSGSESLV